MTLTEKEEKAFKKLQESIARIRSRTEKGIESAVRKFRRSCKDSKLAYTPPIFSLLEPKLYTLSTFS